MPKVTTSNWQAWINLMPVQPKPGGTLHVTADVDTGSTDFAHLSKAVPQGINPMILLLELKVERGIVPATNPQQVHYSEVLSKKNKYTEIQVRLKSKVVKTLKSIDEVH